MGEFKLIELPVGSKSNGDGPPGEALDPRKCLSDLHNQNLLKDISNELGCSPEDVLRSIRLVKSMLGGASRLLACVNDNCGCALNSVAILMHDASEGKLPDGGLEEWDCFLRSTDPCTPNDISTTVGAKMRRAKDPALTPVGKSPRPALKKRSKAAAANSGWAQATAIASANPFAAPAGVKSVVPAGYVGRIANCSWCGVQFPDKSGRAKFCSKSCAASGRPSTLKIPPRLCKVCGIQYVPINTKDLHCSVACRSTGLALNNALVLAKVQIAPPVSTSNVSRATCELRFTKGSSNKFWRIYVDSNRTTVTTEWGRIGARPQRRQEVFTSLHVACRKADKEVSAKLAKGYVAYGNLEDYTSAVVVCPQCGEDFFEWDGCSQDPDYCTDTCFSTACGYNP